MSTPFAAPSRPEKSASLGRAVRRGAVVAAVALLAGTNLGAGCGIGNSGSVTSVDVPLLYIPRDHDEIPPVRLPAGAAPVKIQIADTDDKREDADRRSIGRNIEDAQPIPVYATGGSVAGFVNKVLQQEVAAAKLATTDDMALVTRRLVSEIQTFQVTEASSYSGDVALNFRVIDQTGKSVFERAYKGSSGNHGRSKSAENYQQTFSDATREAVKKLLADADFAASLVDEKQ